MIIAIASGKGGTGKTTLAINLALSLSNIQLLDCDVEEPNVHLFIKARNYDEKKVYSPIPRVNEELCDYCGKCAKVCQFNAIAIISNKVMIFQELCHSCGLCSYICPKKAIYEENREVGVVRKANLGNIEFVYGILKLREPVPGPVIRAVKEEIKDGKDIIIDSPPGTSCPVIESVYGSDFCILVSEPTPFGLHDLKLMVKTLKTLNIPFGVVVNKAGIGDSGIYKYCKDGNIPILLEIPYSKRIAELYSKGIPFIDEISDWKPKLRELFENVKEMVKK